MSDQKAKKRPTFYLNGERLIDLADRLSTRYKTHVAESLRRKTMRCRAHASLPTRDWRRWSCGTCTLPVPEPPLPFTRDYAELMIQGEARVGSAPDWLASMREPSKSQVRKAWEAALVRLGGLLNLESLIPDPTEAARIHDRDLADMAQDKARRTTERMLGRRP